MSTPRLTGLRGISAVFVLLSVFTSIPAPLLNAGTETPSVCTQAPRPFNEGWRFSLGENEGAETVSFVDASWRQLDLPHDWSIEPPLDAAPGVGPHEKEIPDGQNVGHLRGGIGWYRKHFTLSPSEAGKGVDLIFDGAQQDSDVWINGKYLGFQPHGYIAFHHALLPYLNAPGQDNVIAVRVLNPDSNTRWYSGSGLYREVSLRFHDPLHIPVWGARIDTLWISGEKTQIQLRLDVQNDKPEPQDLTLEVILTDPDGQKSTHGLGTLRIAPNQTEYVNQALSLDKSKPWSTEHPRLYKAEFRLLQKGRLVDSREQSFGVRTISVSAEKGLLLNGQSVKLRGACLHHDNGLLGAAAFRDAEFRRVAIMKRNGYNAIRTSHNPPSSAFLDACDQLGILVIDEFVDHWQLPKKSNGYQRYFDKHWEQDLGAMIARDFNHPSVIIWSIGNEIAERHNSAGIEIGRRLADFVHAHDARRPVTNALCGTWENPTLPGLWDANAPAFEFLDVGGYNYYWSNYESDHAQYPRRVMVGTESYPKEAFENWRAVEKFPYVIGDFVWTGMDHIGESGIGHTDYFKVGESPDKTCLLPWGLRPWPWWINWSGDIDLIGNKKPQSLYRDVVWRESQIELAVHEALPDGMAENVGPWGWPAELPSWNWQTEEGKTLSVNVYSRANRVRLELNGRLIGEQAIDTEKGITANFTVPYEPGRLKASALKDGQVFATKELITTGKPAALRLSPETARLSSSRSSLIYVPIEVVDAKGNLVPDATVTLKLELSGAVEVQAFGSANPIDISSLKDKQADTFRGQALAILRPTGKPGKITLRIQSEGLQEAKLLLELPEAN